MSDIMMALGEDVASSYSDVFAQGGLEANEVI